MQWFGSHQVPDRCVPNISQSTNMSRNLEQSLSDTNPEFYPLLHNRLRGHEINGRQLINKALGASWSS